MRAPALLVSASLASVFAAIGFAACVDSPVTAEQLQADRLEAVARTSEMRGVRSGNPQGSPHGSYAERDAPVAHQAAFTAKREQVAQFVQVSAVLAEQPTGPLEDRAEFDADVGTVYLHVRADGLLRTRDVLYRWRHEDFTAEIPGKLMADDALSLGASFKIDPKQAGHWSVDVLAPPRGDEKGEQDARPLFHREFVVHPPRA